MPLAQIFRADREADALVVVGIPQQDPFHDRYGLPPAAELRIAERGTVGRAQEGPVLQVPPLDEFLHVGRQQTRAQRIAPHIGLQRRFGPALPEERVSQMRVAVDEPGMARDQLLQPPRVAGLRELSPVPPVQKGVQLLGDPAVFRRVAEDGGVLAQIDPDRHRSSSPGIIAVAPATGPPSGGSGP